MDVLSGQCNNDLTLLHKLSEKIPKDQVAKRDSGYRSLREDPGERTGVQKALTHLKLTESRWTGHVTRTLDKGLEGVLRTHCT